jgi:hypothetical protein
MPRLVSYSLACVERRRHEPGDDVVSHLVHQETTFDQDTVRRHITVLVLTPTRLVVAHADDHGPEHDETEPDQAATESTATATSECVPLSAVRGVMLTHENVVETIRFRAASHRSVRQVNTRNMIGNSNSFHNE